jgi:hypothetical protein
MRQSEIERLKTLRLKVETGGELSEKEIIRLEQLENKLKEENEKNGIKEETSTNEPTVIRGSGFESVESSTGSGQETGTGTGTELKNGSGQDNGVNDVSGQGDGGIIESGKFEQSNGDNSGELREQSTVNNREGGADNNTDNRSENGSNGSNNGSTGEARGQETKLSQPPNFIKGDLNVKPQKKPVKKSPPKSTDITSTDIISAVLQSGFDIVAKVTNKQHWMIEKAEADSVADPLSKMLDSMSAAQKKKFEKMSNPIMLAAAVAGIVVPRISMDLLEMKYKKESVLNANRKQQASNISRESVNTDIGESGVNERRTAASSDNSTNIDKTITSIINSSNNGYGGTNLNI